MAAFSLKELTYYIKSKTQNGFEQENPIFLQNKLDKILNNCQQKNAAFNSKLKEINHFIQSGEINKNKVLLFCEKLKPAHIPEEQVNFCFSNKAYILSVENLSFNTKDEFEELFNYIQTHKKDLSFSETVYKVMNAHHIKTAPEVYKRAFMSRKDYSRILNPNNKNVSKKLVWQLIIGLRCTLKEADEILFSAGYSRKNILSDIILEYFIINGNFNIMEINQALEALECSVFTCYRDVKEKDNI